MAKKSLKKRIDEALNEEGGAPFSSIIPKIEEVEREYGSMNFDLAPYEGTKGITDWKKIPGLRNLTPEKFRADLAAYEQSKERFPTLPLATDIVASLTHLDMDPNQDPFEDSIGDDDDAIMQANERVGEIVRSWAGVSKEEMEKRWGDWVS